MKPFFIKAALSLFCCTLLLSFLPEDASAIPSRPSPPRLVNDFAGVLSSSQQGELEALLDAFNDSTSTQIAVVVVPDLEGLSSAEYATEIGEKWGVGSKEHDNGVVILVKPKNQNGSGDVFIAVGYGLEGAIPDAYAKRIIEEIMVPKFKEDDYYGAISGACSKIIGLARGEGFPPAEDDDVSWWEVILTLGLIGALFYWYSKKIKSNGGGTGGSNGTGSGPRRPFIFIPPSSGGSSRRGGFGGFGGGSFGGGGAGSKW